MIEIIRDNWLLLLIGQYPHGPLGGLAMTLILASSSLILAFPLAIGIALLRTSGSALFHGPAQLYVDVMRGFPLIMVVFWSYFVIPQITGYAVDGVTTMLIALVIYESAYVSEIVRAGILAIPVGQLEAAKSLGLGFVPTTARIVLPQALYNMIPSLISQFASVIKGTSLAYIISAQEFTFSAQQINAALLDKPLEVFGVVAIVFFILCSSLNLLAMFVEKRLKYEQ